MSSCGGDTVDVRSVCEHRFECAGFPTSGISFETCIAQFDQARESAAEAGCTDEHDRFLRCATTVPCGGNCDAEYEPVQACFDK
jgi:hypothetical protein